MADQADIGMQDWPSWARTWRGNADTLIRRRRLQPQPSTNRRTDGAHGGEAAFAGPDHSPVHRQNRQAARSSYGQGRLTQVDEAIDELNLPISKRATSSSTAGIRCSPTPPAATRRVKQKIASSAWAFPAARRRRARRPEHDARRRPRSLGPHRANAVDKMASRSMAFPRLRPGPRAGYYVSNELHNGIEYADIHPRQKPTT